MTEFGSTSIWLAILVIGLFTFLWRLSFIYLFGRVESPVWLEQFLRYIPAAVLSAIVWPALVLVQGQVSLGLDNLRLWAGLAALIVAVKTSNVFLTIGAGMSALWVLQYFLA